MKSFLLLCLLLCGNIRGFCDDASGPSRSTIQKLAWGSIYYEPGKQGGCQVEPTSDGYRFTSSQGEVVIKGSEANGYRLSWGREFLTINQTNGDLEVHVQDKTWTVRSVNGRVTLTSSSPRDTIAFERSANTFTIAGGKGKVAVSTEFGNLLLKSSQGTTTVTSDSGKRTFAGPALEQIPYLGRGLFIPFHGVGVFVDITKRFPMPELTEWVEWKAILD